ncbi:50S ribosomal protein L29 [Candidatus Micrarchaeota archaeon]|nr:50S ribosomal protein L29 [Candidatus Micrarchaeota archaeon]
MALISKKKLKDMTVDDLKAELLKVRSEYRVESGSRATTGKPNNPGRYKQLRRLNARLLTLLRQKGVKIGTEGRTASTERSEAI